MAYTAPAARPSGAAQRPVPLTQFAKDSVGVTGTAAAPAASTVVATITPSVAGVYSVQVNAGLGVGGTPSGTENANMRLRVDGTAISTLPMVGGANVIVGCGTFILTVNGSQAIDVQTIAGPATASTVYIAQIIPTLLYQTGA